MNTNIITGLRRSGTSMLMFAMKNAGANVVGDKFAKETIKEGNPNGYWEVDGVTTETGLVEPIDGTVKIMMEALPFSKPELVNKVVVIFRKPRNVLSSFFKHNEIDNIDLFALKNILDIIDTLGFLTLNNKEYIITFYEDILNNKEDEIKKVCDFLGEKDYKKAASVINEKVKHEKEYSEESTAIDIMECVYNYAKENRIKEIISLEREIKEYAKYLYENNNSNTNK